MAAGKEVMNVDWDTITKCCSAKGTIWNFTPAGAQWRNGAVEIFVKKFKKSFEVLYSKTRLDFAEMACAVKCISCILNERPLSVQKSVKAYADTRLPDPNHAQYASYLKEW